MSYSIEQVNKVTGIKGGISTIMLSGLLSITPLVSITVAVSSILAISTTSAEAKDVNKTKKQLKKGEKSKDILDDTTLKNKKYHDKKSKKVTPEKSEYTDEINSTE